MKTHILAAAVLICAAGFAHAAPSRKAALANIDGALHAGNPATRKIAVEALGIAGSAEPYQARLELMLKDKDVKVRLAAVASLSEANHAEVLRAALDDRTPEVRFAAAKALYAMNDPAARQALIRFLNGGAKTESGFLARQERAAARVFETPKALETATVRGAIDFAPVPGLRAGALVTTRMMSKASTANRASVALMLAKSGDADAAEALVRALDDKHAAVRAAAIHAIALSGNPEMAGYAEKMLADKDRTVRLNASACYLRLTQVEPVAGAGGE
jgi:HEAT repeat protein